MSFGGEEYLFFRAWPCTPWGWGAVGGQQAFREVILAVGGTFPRGFARQGPGGYPLDSWLSCYWVYLYFVKWTPFFREAVCIA